MTSGEVDKRSSHQVTKFTFSPQIRVDRPATRHSRDSRRGLLLFFMTPVARPGRASPMGGGGQGQSRDDGVVAVPEPTEADTDAHISGLVGTIFASVLWMLRFGDGESQSVRRIIRLRTK